MLKLSDLKRYVQPLLTVLRQPLGVAKLTIKVREIGHLEASKKKLGPLKLEKWYDYLETYFQSVTAGNINFRGVFSSISDVLDVKSSAATRRPNDVGSAQDFFNGFLIYLQQRTHLGDVLLPSAMVSQFLQLARQDLLLNGLKMQQADLEAAIVQANKSLAIYKESKVKVVFSH